MWIWKISGRSISDVEEVWKERYRKVQFKIANVFYEDYIDAAVQIPLEQTACGMNNSEFSEILLFKIHHSFQDCFLNLFYVWKVLIKSSSKA